MQPLQSHNMPASLVSLCPECCSERFTSINKDKYYLFMRNLPVRLEREGGARDCREPVRQPMEATLGWEPRPGHQCEVS